MIHIYVRLDHHFILIYLISMKDIEACNYSLNDITKLAELLQL